MDERRNAIAIAEIKGNMTAMRAENDAMESRIDASLAKMRADMASFREDAERRDRENRRWVVGLVLGAAVLVIAVLGILIRWPAPPV